MVEKKEKQYVSDNARLMEEWDWEKNEELGFDSHELTCGSHKKVWWKCSEGHEWQTAVSDRNSGTGCPYCAGNKILKGYNDLQTINPALAKEWNYEKNNDLTPSDVMPNSHKKVWWKCSKGHEWQAKIYHRNHNIGCPYCAGLVAIKGENDLQTINPILAEEWNYEKNGAVTPVDMLPSSGKKVWWKCKKGHEWQATIANRNSGSKCPICNSESQTSFPEYALIYYLRSYGLDAIQTYKENGYELDVYIPSKKIAIEYDGHYWHKNKKNQDLIKNHKCEKDGIKLYRIREELPPLYDSSIDYIVERNQKDLSKILRKVLKTILNTNVDVDIERDSIAIQNLREYTNKERSLSLVNPEITIEWNYEMNKNLRPESFTVSSNKKVWWKCSEGHEWQARIADRNKGDGCPYCSGLYVVKGENDLQTINPALAEEWNYEKNYPLKPENFSSKSSKKVWWKCSEGHEWQALIKHRQNGSRCPYCIGKYAIKGKNDLQTVNPILATEWNYEKNYNLTPSDVLPNSGKKVWWKCKEGHEWQATISNRNNGRGCPICAKEKRKSSVKRA